MFPLGRDLDINFGFCRIRISDRNLSYSYKQDFSRILNHTSFESKIKKAETATSSFWKTSFVDKWKSSK